MALTSDIPAVGLIILDPNKNVWGTITSHEKDGRYIITFPDGTHTFRVNGVTVQKWLESGYAFSLNTRVNQISPTCECGGTKLRLPHSNWCPIK